MPLLRSGANFSLQPGGAASPTVEIGSSGLAAVGASLDVVDLFHGLFTTALTTYDRVTDFSYTSTEHRGTTVTFDALLETTSGSVTATLELYNVTDGSSVATLTSTSTTPEKVSTTVTMASGTKTYRLRLKHNGGVLDAATVTAARLKIT